jgi:hypothetical protein
MRLLARVVAAAPTWFVAIVRRGPRAFLPGYRLASTLCWLGVVLAPVVAIVALALAIATSWWWLLVGIVLTGAALAPAVALTVVKARIRRGQRVPSWIGGMKTGRRGSSPEVKYGSAVGQNQGRTRPSPHDAVPRPRVTVVIACYNDAHLLGAALHSVQRQTMGDLQCVVVDDGSTDESFDVALLAAEVDARFEVVRHDVNRGLSAARNTGLARATGEYVTFLDSDDFLFAHSLERRLAAVVKDASCVGAYCDWRSVPEESAYRADSGASPAERPIVHLLATGYEVPFIASAPLVQTDAMRAAGGFDETLSTAEDADMWSRLLRGGVWLAYAEDIGVAYRQRENSMVRRSPLEHLTVVTGVTERLDTPWEPWPGAPDPIAEPLGDALRRASLLPRQLNFVALHVALFGPEGVEAEHLPEPELRSLPDYREQVTEQSRRALVRLGKHSDEATAELAAQVLALAPAFDSPLVLPETPVDRSVRGRVLVADLSRRDVVELRDAEPCFLLVPQSRYHIAEVGPLYAELRARGVNAQIFCPPEAPVGVYRELMAFTDTVYRGDPDALTGAPLLGTFVLNDWGPSPRAAIDAVATAGGVSFSKVEGVQDFTDADTGRIREPYRRSDVVLGQGVNDVEALPGREVVVVGSSRLERIRAGAEAPSDASSVLINLNFTYGVLAEAQDTWLWEGVRGAQAVGIDYEISAHPAQKNIPKDPEVQDHLCVDPFSHALRRSGVLISRFSTVLYEAMALGVPVIYLNTHGEKVPTFQDPQGAFLKVTEPGLTGPLTEALSWRGSYRERSDAFFRRQVDVDPDRSSEARAADAIVARIRV